MRKHYATSALLLLASPCFGQDAAAPFSGHATLGIRSVDVGGADSKYLEDVNLSDGARVLDVSLAYIAPGGSANLVDRVNVSADGLGGDPFETLHLDAHKFGRYKLKLDRRRSEYFYQDVILPSEFASVPASTAGDLHHFDFTRVRDTADLAIDISARTKLNIGLEHQTRTGDSTSSQGIQRDQFVLDNPLDESLSSIDIGVEQAWDKVTLIVDEQAQDFENASSLFLPGASIGQNPDDAAELFSFARDQAYDYQSRAHMVRVLVRPTLQLDFQAAVRREDLTLDLNASEQSRGIDFAGQPFATDQNGFGSAERDVDLDELTFGYTVNERFRLIGALRDQSLVQHGSLLFGTEAGDGRWAIETAGMEAGVSIAVRPRVVVSAGLSTEHRDAAFTRALGGATLTQDEDTERDGYFASAEWRRSGGLNLTARFEDNSIDEPFALGSPTGSRRIKLTARYEFSNGVHLSASHRSSDLENDASGWSAETEQTDLRLRYAIRRVDVSVGYAAIEFARDIDQLVTGGTRQDVFAIDYAADTNFVDASARWRWTDRMALGGAVRAYENDGSFPLRRDDWRAFLELDLGSTYVARVTYRDLDYTEDAFDDYDARILELGLAVNW